MCVAATARRRRRQMKIDKRFKRKDSSAWARRRAAQQAKAEASGRSFGYSKR